MDNTDNSLMAEHRGKTEVDKEYLRRLRAIYEEVRQLAPEITEREYLMIAAGHVIFIGDLYGIETPAPWSSLRELIMAEVQGRSKKQ